MSDVDPKVAKAEERKLFVEALKSKHKRVSVIEFDGDDRFIVVRKPTRSEYDSWFDMGGPTGKQATKRQLLDDCTLHPSKEEVDALLEDYPAALAGACMGAIYELAGMGKATARAAK